MTYYISYLGLSMSSGHIRAGKGRKNRTRGKKRNAYYHVQGVAKRMGVAKCHFLRDRKISLPDLSLEE